jgi:kynurenine 3-monooxygenase
LQTARDNGLRAREADVAIVGGGLVGSLLAAFLVDRGHRVTVYERRADLRTGEAEAGRSINLVLTRRGLRALDAVGLARGAMDLTVPVRGRMLHEPDGAVRFQPYGRDRSESNHSISRADLNEYLVAEAERRGAVFRFRHRMVDLDPGRGRLTFADEATGRDVEIDAGIVVGADGAGSAVRAALVRRGLVTEDVALLDHGYKELSIPADARGGPRIEPHALHIWPRGEFMLMALPNRDSSFTGTLYLPHRGEPGFDSVRSADDVRELFRRHFPDALDLFDDVADEYARNPVGTLGTVRCEPWGDGERTTLVGDAAHAIVPFFGQGMNAGFEDCRILGERIDAGGGDARAALVDLGRLRRPDTDAMADMALDNFVEMRDRVADPAFLLRKAIEHRLEREMPDTFRSRYSMVMYSHIPFRTARAAGDIGAAIVDDLARGVRDAGDVDLEQARRLVRERLTPFLERSGASLDY